jgi:hypothetical protein
MNKISSIRDDLTDISKLVIIFAIALLFAIVIIIFNVFLLSLHTLGVVQISRNKTRVLVE